MDASQAEVDAVAIRISRYLNEHPDAADTVEGVALWWLSGNRSNEWMRTVQRAIEQLAGSGEVAIRVLPDGAVMVELNDRHGCGSA